MSAKHTQFVIMRAPVAGHTHPVHRFMCGPGSWAPDLNKALLFKSPMLAQVALGDKPGEVVSIFEAQRATRALRFEQSGQGENEKTGARV